VRARAVVERVHAPEKEREESAASARLTAASVDAMAPLVARSSSRSSRVEPAPPPAAPVLGAVPEGERAPYPAEADLGVPPPDAHPFAYVDKEPRASTPAAKAGLRRGDALLRIGEASRLCDVQAQLQASVHSPLPVLLIDVRGRLLQKWVVPHPFDALAPAALLGCALSDTCPVDLIDTDVARPPPRGRADLSADAPFMHPPPADRASNALVNLINTGGGFEARPPTPTVCFGGVVAVAASAMLTLFALVGTFGVLAFPNVSRQHPPIHTLLSTPYHSRPPIHALPFTPSHSHPPIHALPFTCSRLSAREPPIHPSPTLHTSHR
jgi:hypothetical protein